MKKTERRYEEARVGEWKTAHRVRESEERERRKQYIGKRSRRNRRTGDKETEKERQCARCERRECDRVTEKKEEKKECGEKEKSSEEQSKRREYDNVTEKME